MTQAETRERLNRDLADMGCPYKVGDDRVDAWNEGYRAGLRFAMGLPAPAIAKARGDTPNG